MGLLADLVKIFAGLISLILLIFFAAALAGLALTVPILIVMWALKGFGFL